MQQNACFDANRGLKRPHALCTIGKEEPPTPTSIKSLALALYSNCLPYTNANTVCSHAHMQAERYALTSEVALAGVFTHGK